MRIGVEGSTSKGLSLNSQQNISLERNDVSNLPARLLVYDGAQRVDGLDLYTSDSVQWMSYEHGLVAASRAP